MISEMFSGISSSMILFFLAFVILMSLKNILDTFDKRLFTIETFYITPEVEPEPVVETEAQAEIGPEAQVEIEPVKKIVKKSKKQ